MPFKTIKLNDGRHVPQIGFGTWKIPVPECASQTDQAIEVGFDHIDSAQAYRNEDGVGQALKESGISRKDFWITTKYSFAERSIKDSIHHSLEFIGTDHVDLYLIHSPRLCKGDIPGSWKEMEKLHKSGKAKSIGVSNFQIEDLKECLHDCTVPPAVNQILLHPYVIEQTQPLLDFMKKHNIAIEAYSVLTSLTSRPGGPVDKPVNEIASRLNIKPEQVLLAWAKYKHAIILTTSSKKERLQNYLAVGDIDLTEDDVKAIDEAGAKGARAEKRRQLMRRIGVTSLTIGAMLYAGARLLA